MQGLSQELDERAVRGPVHGCRRHVDLQHAFSYARHGRSRRARDQADGEVGTAIALVDRETSH